MRPARRFSPYPARRFGRATLLTLAATALLAACGDDDSSPADTTAPTVVITDDVSDATATGDVLFTFTFSEDVGTTFTSADVALTGGSKGAFTRSSATVYTLVAIPPEDAAGTLQVSVAAGAYADLAGNANTGSASATQPFDTRSAALAQMTLPVTFDDAGVEYGLVGFGGADASTVVVDPTDASNQVAKVVKAADAQGWAGTTITVPGTPQPGFAAAIPFDASNTRMTVRVWSPDAGIPVRLKAEDHTDNTKTVETEALTTVAAGWETLTFDFADEAPGTAALTLANSYDKVSIFFNFGVTGAIAGEKTYYFDDVVFVGGGGTGGGGGGGAPFATVTFEPADGSYTLTSFGGTASSLEVDPTSATNQVVKVIKTGAAELWAGTTFSTGPGATVGVIPFDASNTRMTVRVWSPDAGIPVRLKVEDHTAGAVSVETEALTTVAGAWETLTFDFADEAGAAALNLASTYDRASIFFNFGVTGATAGEKTYYFDDVVFVGGGGTGGGGGGGGTPFATVTFDESSVTYTLTDFEGAINGAVVDDPAGGTNKVGKNEKPSTAQPWAGTTVSTGPNLSVGRIPFASGKTTMTMRVYSPDAGIQVRLKVEDSTNVGITCETEATTTVANAWETLTFDFANEAAGTAELNLSRTYDKLSVFFNFLVATSGETKVYYYDDLAFVP